MNTITTEQLESINTDLSARLKQLAEQLAEEKPNIKSGYWVIVEQHEDKVFISADNGYDISESIEVNNVDGEKILALL